MIFDIAKLSLTNLEKKCNCYDGIGGRGGRSRNSGYKTRVSKPHLGDVSNLRYLWTSGKNI